MAFAGTGLAPSETMIVPPEEAPHQRTFMQWPVNRRVHSDPIFLDMAQQTIADIANTIVEFEPVTLLMAADDIGSARSKLSQKVEVWDIPTEDLWCRDAGPIFARTPKGGLVVSHIQFNGWGGKQVHKRDARIAAEVALRLGLPLIDAGLRGEAGDVEQGGQGLLIAHESSWVNDNRHKGLSRDEVEAQLLAAYGAVRMIWSPGVRGEDITDYHIDSLARLTGPGRLLINLLEPPGMGDPLGEMGGGIHCATQQMPA